MHGPIPLTTYSVQLFFSLYYDGVIRQKKTDMQTHFYLKKSILHSVSFLAILQNKRITEKGLGKKRDDFQ